MAVIQFKDGNVKGSYCHTPLLWLVCVLNPGSESHPVSGFNNLRLDLRSKIKSKILELLSLLDPAPLISSTVIIPVSSPIPPLPL